MKLADVRRRYANARRRARYWSGIPSFNVRLRSNQMRSATLDLKYELAMCDCDSWEQVIEKMTGKRPPHYDPKRSFAVRFSKLLLKA